MVKRNSCIARLRASYLFPEIAQRKREFLAQHPTAKLISLGIGDTTQPLPSTVAAALAKSAASLSTIEGYTGYGPEQGSLVLRQKIASVIYNDLVAPDEIFISDGAKSAIGRLQLLFGCGVKIAIQDPAYPVYVDGSTMQGVENLVFMPCLPDNQFFPRLDPTLQADLIYFCSPNNPTGAAATREQLEQLVSFARQQGAIIIYDSAYASYIKDPTLPRSIFEIDGARDVAIETSSFSKMVGFTGVRLGWSVVPQELAFDDGSSVHQDWMRVISTVFNGASNIAQQGGLAVLTPEGMAGVEELTTFYLENIRVIKDAFLKKNFRVFGGEHAPYLWVHFPGKASWVVFQHLLEQLHIVTTPGSGFGSAGEGFIRFTGFGSRADTFEAAERIRQRIPEAS